MEWLRTATNRSAIRLLQSGYRNAVNTLFPGRCPICETLVDAVGDVCTDCAGKLKYITSPFCMICGKQLEDDTGEVCSDCERKHHSFVRGVGALAYTKDIKQSMYRFKYSNRREYAVFYSDILIKLKGHIIEPWKPDVIVPVPLHAARYRKRGYNQAGLIAEEIGRRLGVLVDEGLLVRNVNTAPQKELNDKERTKNTKNAFQVIHNIVKYKRVLLVDDIYTTGATLDACSDALTNAGAAQVYFAAVCIGRGF